MFNNANLMPGEHISLQVGLEMIHCYTWRVRRQ